MTRWIGFSIFMWVVGLIVGSIPVGQNLVENSTVTDPIYKVTSYTQAFTSQQWGQIVSPMFHIDFFSAILKIATLDLPIFGGPNDPMQIFRWIFLGPVIGTIVFGLVVALITIFSYALS